MAAPYSPSLEDRIMAGTEGANPRLQTLARSGDQAAQQEISRQQDSAAREQEQQSQQQAREQDRQQQVAQHQEEQLRRQQEREQAQQHAETVRRAAAAGIERETDPVTGHQEIATNLDGTPRYKTGPVGGIEQLPTPQSTPYAIPGVGEAASLMTKGPVEMTKPVQKYRDSHGNEIYDAPDGQKTDTQGNTYVTRKDAYGRDIQVPIGEDPEAKKKIDLTNRSNEAALRKQQLAQAQLQFKPEHDTAKQDFHDAEREMKALPNFRQDETGTWVTAGANGSWTPVKDDQALERYHKQRGLAETKYYRAKHALNDLQPRADALNAAEDQAKQDHINLESERLRNELGLPQQDGGVSRILASDATGDNPHARFLREFGITPADDATPAIPPNEAEPQQPADRLPATQSAQQALGTLKGVQNLTITPQKATALVERNGQWLGTVEPDNSGHTVLTLRDDALQQQDVADLVDFGKTSNELQLYLRENPDKMNVKEAAEWATQVHAIKNAATQPAAMGMLGGADAGGAAGASGIPETTQLPATNGERAKALMDMGADPDAIRRKVSAGVLPVQIGQSVLQELYGESLATEKFDTPEARQKWIEQKTKDEIAAGTRPDQTTAAKWKQASTRNSNWNALAGPVSAFFSTYSLADMNQLEMDRAADANKLEQGITPRANQKARFGKDFADTATIGERINSMATALGKGGIQAAASTAGMPAGIFVNASEAEVALIGKALGAFSATAGATGQEAMDMLSKSMGLRTGDWEAFALGTTRNLQAWTTPRGMQTSANLTSAVGNLEAVVDQQADALKPDNNAIYAAAIKAGQAALEMHFLAPDKDWPITMNDLDPTKDAALGSALQRYIETADPRQLDLYKQRLLMGNGRRFVSGEIEKKTQGLGTLGEGFVGSLDVGYHQLISEAIGDASFGVLGAISKAGKVAGTAGKIAEAAATANRVTSMADRIVGAVEKFESWGIKADTLTNPLTKLDKARNFAVSTGKLIAYGSGVEEPVEGWMTEIGEDQPDFVKAYWDNAIGSFGMLPGFIAMHHAGGVIANTVDNSDKARDRINQRWVDTYNQHNAGTPGFQPVTFETARAAAALLDPRIQLTEVQRMAAAQSALNYSDPEINPTAEETAAVAQGQQARQQYAATEAAAQSLAITPEARQNLENDASNIQRLLEDPNLPDARRADLSQQHDEVMSRLRDSQATDQLPALQQQIDAAEPIEQIVSDKLKRRQQIQLSAQVLAQMESDSVEAVNQIAAEPDPSRRTYMTGMAKVAAGNAHLLTKNERAAIQGARTQAGASFFDSTVDPHTGEVTEALTDEGRAELRETYPAIGRLIQTQRSDEIFNQNLTDQNEPDHAAAKEANNQQIARVPLAPEHLDQARQIAAEVMARINQAHPEIGQRVTTTEQAGDMLTGGLVNDKNGTRLIIPDIAQAVAQGMNDHEQIVQQLTDLAILHEAVHDVETQLILEQARANGDTRSDNEIIEAAGQQFYDAYAAADAAATADPNNHHPVSLLAMGRDLYGPTWDQIPDGHKARELNRMIVEGMLTGKTTDLYRALTKYCSASQ